jgi:hypothetical protein
MRHDIDLILEELWRDAACRDAIRAVAARSEGVLSEFLSAVLNDLMYLFKVRGGWRRLAWRLARRFAAVGATGVGGRWRKRGRLKALLAAAQGRVKLDRTQPTPTNAQPSLPKRHCRHRLTHPVSPIII